MKLKPILPALLMCLLCCKQTFSQRIQKGSLPPDFNCPGCVLVILKHTEDKNVHHINEMVEKKLIGNYDGKNVFITEAELDTNSLYKNDSVYRFVLGGEPYSFTQSNSTGDGRGGAFTSTATPLDFHLYDRLTKKGYPQISNYPSWSKTMEKVAGALNKLLKK
jgi:hypothetical protein